MKSIILSFSLNSLLLFISFVCLVIMLFCSFIANSINCLLVFFLAVFWSRCCYLPFHQIINLLFASCCRRHVCTRWMIWDNTLWTNPAYHCDTNYSCHGYITSWNIGLINNYNIAISEIHFLAFPFLVFLQRLQILFLLARPKLIGKMLDTWNSWNYLWLHG